MLMDPMGPIGITSDGNAIVRKITAFKLDLVITKKVREELVRKQLGARDKATEGQLRAAMQYNAKYYILEFLKIPV